MCRVLLMPRSGGFFAQTWATGGIALCNSAAAGNEMLDFTANGR